MVVADGSIYLSVDYRRFQCDDGATFSRETDNKKQATKFVATY